MDDWNLYFRFLAHSYDREIMDYEKRELPRKDVYYKSNGVVVSERGRYILAIKGGDNGDSHNHHPLWQGHIDHALRRLHHWTHNRHPYVEVPSSHKP